MRFNPRAREGRDTCHGAFLKMAKVSIHAPARGATSTSVSLTACVAGFNPRAREGRDPIVNAEAKRLLVSIHAPARGATRHWQDTDKSHLFQSTRPRGARHSRRAEAEVGYPFQSTRPRGARLKSGRLDEAGAKFQSTRPRGARQLSPPPPIATGGFNPRAREGRDTCHSAFLKMAKVSIHAPARGATK